MTFEQAQLYIKIFILQHYDENIEEVIKNCEVAGKVSDLCADEEGDWRCPNIGYLFWARSEEIKRYNKICLNSLRNTTDTNFNILDYISLQEETP